MNILDKIQEKYIQEFTQNIPLDEFLLNIVVTAVLVGILRLFYIKYAQTVNNRRRFSINFLPLALGTLLIIMIVKSSIALSLGLVGALSIVRYRAAIKEPEELTYLFIAIGLGLAGGANQPVLAIVAFTVILLLLLLGKLLSGQAALKKESGVLINISTDSDDLEQISKIMTSTLKVVELRRMDTLDKGLELSFSGEIADLQQLNEMKKQITALSPKTKLTVINQPNIAL